MEIATYTSFLDYASTVSIYVSRITAVTAALLAIIPVYTALKICWANRHLPLSGIVPALKPFDITVLFRGILLCCVGAIFGGVSFTAMDAMYIQPENSWRHDLVITIVWTLWGAGIVSIAAAFSSKPKNMYRGILVFVVGSMLLAFWSGRLG